MRVLQRGPYLASHGGVQTNLVALRDFLRAAAQSRAVINRRASGGRARTTVVSRKIASGVVAALRLRYT